jgi:hypothetical protein
MRLIVVGSGIVGAACAYAPAAPGLSSNSARATSPIARSERSSWPGRSRTVNRSGLGWNRRSSERTTAGPLPSCCSGATCSAVVQPHEHVPDQVVQQRGAVDAADVLRLGEAWAWLADVSGQRGAGVERRLA